MPVVRPDTEKPRGRLSCESPLGILEFPDPVSAAFPLHFRRFLKFLPISGGFASVCWRTDRVVFDPESAETGS